MDRIRYDADYISYIELGESTAVFIVREKVKSIDTSGMWIDILKLDGYKNKDNRWNFKYFTIELFPRKKNPKYPDNVTEKEAKYITWKTAHEDIAEQRSRGYKGLKFRIDLKLVNRNEGKYRKVKAAWNLTFNQWVPDLWFGSSCEWRQRKIPYEPEWDYEISATKRL